MVHRLGQNERKVNVFLRSYFCPTNEIQKLFLIFLFFFNSLSDAVVLEQDNTWIKVFPNETVPFTFGGRGKVRHRDTHTVRVHQLAVRVDMWKPAAPVSVDKVGVYFRQAAPMPSDKVYRSLRHLNIRNGQR